MPEEVSILDMHGDAVDGLMDVCDGSPTATLRREADGLQDPALCPQHPSLSPQQQSRSAPASRQTNAIPLSENPLPVNAPHRRSTKAEGNRESQAPSSGTTFADSSLELVAEGLYRLMQSQRRFADEFGLGLDRVFSCDIAPLQEKGVDEMKRWLLTGDSESRARLKVLLEDLFQHQAAILSTLDTVARRSIRYLAPEITQRLARQRKGINRFTPLWSQYRERHHKIETNPQSRYKIIIAPGVQSGYASVRQARQLREKGKKTATTRRSRRGR